MKKHHFVALMMLVIFSFSDLRLDAQEVKLIEPETEALTQTKQYFRKISLRPEFFYSEGWLGGDGALSVQLSDTKVLWIFSDSFVSNNPNASKRKRASDMVANTIAISSFDKDQIHTQYFWRRSSRKHHPFFEPDSSTYKFWPVWAFLKNDSVFVLMV